MNSAKTIKEYYSKWLGVTPEAMEKDGVIFTESSERDKKQDGYPHIFDVYTYKTDNQVIISYSKRLTDKMLSIKQKIHCKMTSDEIANIMKSIFNTDIKRSIVFYYDKPLNNIDKSNVIKLRDTDYPKYEEAFKLQYPNVETDSWLEEYYHNITKNEMAFGIFQNDKLVSVTDAPDIPYMQDEIREIGINTLVKYRCRSYAKSVVSACIESIIKNGKCPHWYCDVSNIGSQKVAYGAGFKKLAEIITVSIS